jgi:formylglycine-generating enzyme required for sulfatase activity
MLPVGCPKCGAVTEVPEGARGTTIKCSRCGATLLLGPAPGDRTPGEGKEEPRPGPLRLLTLLGGLVGVLASLTGIAAFVLQVHDRQQQPQRPQSLLGAPPTDPADPRGEERATALGGQPKPQVKPAVEPPAAAPAPTITNSLGMKFVLIPAGTFTMGSSPEEIQRCTDLKRAFPPAASFKAEGPQHEVEITQRFYLGAHEVTVGQFRAFVNDSHAAAGDTWLKPGWEQTEEHPVVGVSWYSAVDFCTWLSQKEGKKYRLPTEAEWEYSCRAGRAGTRYCFGDEDAELAQYAWYHINAESRTHPVGLLKPNAWGLYDMHGNAAEWCQDNYAGSYYKNGPRQNPTGPAASGERVWRGGSYHHQPTTSRSAFRYHYDPGMRNRDCGFRVVLLLSPPH